MKKVTFLFTNFHHFSLQKNNTLQHIKKLNNILFNNHFQFATFDCNNCSQKITKLQCSSCQKMINYFQVFKIPENYQIDSNKIQKEAKYLQKEFHPDKNIDVHQTQKQEYQNYSAYINQAKKTLLDDLQRAIYLMKLRGIDVQQDGKIQDNSFMAQVFQLQLQIQQANTQQQCFQIQNRLQRILDGVKKIFGNRYQSADISQCKQFLQKYIYLKRAFDNIKQKSQQVKKQVHQ